MNSQQPTTVPVTMPAWAWGRLATIAEHRQMRVADLIAEGLEHVLDVDDDRLSELRMELRKHNKTRRDMNNERTGNAS